MTQTPKIHELEPTDERWLDVEAWRQWYEDGFSPLPLQQLTATDCWVLEEHSHVHMSLSRISRWPSPTALLGFVRHGLLPDFFDWWLSRDSWDDDRLHIVPVEALLDRAEAAGDQCKGADAIAMGRRAANELDRVRDASPADILTTVQAVLRGLAETMNVPPMKIRGDVVGSTSELPQLFHRHFGATVEDEFHDDYCLDDDTLTFQTWSTACTHAPDDDAAKQKVLRVLESFNEVA